jgi:polyhydroxybutyrate depolymerase
MKKIFIIIFVISILFIMTLFEKTQSNNIATIITKDNQTRDYKLYTPQNLSNNNEKKDLLIVLHGGFGSAKEVERSLGFNKYAEQYGFFIAYPNGINRHWNDGRGVHTKSDDILFIKEMIENIKIQKNIHKVFVTGISNGAMMTYRLLCEAPFLIDGAAPVIGNLAAPLSQSCIQNISIPTLVINGDKDPFVLQEGGECCTLFGKGLGGELLSTKQSLQILQKQNQCNGEETEILKNTIQDTSSIIKTSYICNTPLISYTIKEGGHTWPPIKPFIKAQGISSKNLDATKTIVEFFMKNSF